MANLTKTITWATGLSDDGTTPLVDWSYGNTTAYGGIIYDLSYGEFGDQGGFLIFISNNTATVRTVNAKIYKALTWEQMGVPPGSFIKSVKMSSFVRTNQTANDGGNIVTGPVEIWDSSDTIFKKTLIDYVSNLNMGWFDALGVVDYVINEPSSTQNVFKIWVTGSASRYPAGPGLFLPGFAQCYVDTLSLDITYIDNSGRLSVNIAHGGI